MSSQYDVLRDHIADFLIFLSSSAPSFWFLLNTSYDHGCHLANRFQMSAQEYESLLVAANLAAYEKSGFIMKPNEWGIFLGGHHFWLSECNIELDKKNGGGGGCGGDGGDGGGREINGGVGGGRGDDSYERRRQRRR